MPSFGQPPRSRSEALRLGVVGKAGVEKRRVVRVAVRGGIAVRRRQHGLGIQPIGIQPRRGRLGDRRLHGEIGVLQRLPLGDSPDPSPQPFELARFMR